MTDKTGKKQIRLPLWVGGLIVVATAAVVKIGRASCRERV